MYYDLIYLIPFVMIIYAIWFFYPLFKGRRKSNISPNEYAWFILSFVCIPIFGAGIFVTILFLESWYTNPAALDIGFVIFCIPWVVIPGAIVSYSIHAIRQLRTVRHATEEEIA